MLGCLLLLFTNLACLMVGTIYDGLKQLVAYC